MITLTVCGGGAGLFNPELIAVLQERPNFWIGGATRTVTYVWAGGGDPHIVLESIEQINVLIEAAQ